MSVLALHPVFWIASDTKSDQSRADPPPLRLTGPVFIGDAVTPWMGETALSLRLKENQSDKD